MTDRLSRLLLEIQGQAGKLEAQHETALHWMSDMRNGHPKAQDFEPTGHGGSDPTSQNGTRDDYAVRDGKQYVQAIERAWRALDAAAAISRRYQNGTKPERKPDDAQDVWCVVHLALDYHEPRAHMDLCDPCYRYKVNHNGAYPTKEDVEHYIAHYGRWPSQRIDPTKPMALASVERLKLHTEAVSAEEAASILQEM